MPLIFIGVGSNIEPEKNLTHSLQLLNESMPVRAISTHYRTSPLNGRSEQDDYINGVWKIESELSPSDLKKLVLSPIEKACGRKRTSDKYASRPVDLDILLWGDMLIPGSLPDPDLFTRPFLAFPLLELSPALILPGETVLFREQIALLPPPDCVDTEITNHLNEILTTN